MQTNKIKWDLCARKQCPVAAVELNRLHAQCFGGAKRFLTGGGAPNGPRRKINAPEPLRPIQHTFLHGKQPQGHKRGGNGIARKEGICRSS